MQTKHKLFLALASTTLAAAACGGSSSSSNDESSSSNGTGGVGGSSAAGGDSGAGGTSPGTTVSASSAAANSVGGSGGSNAATTTVDAGSSATTSVGGAGGTSGAAGAPDGSDSGETSSAGGVGGSGGSGGTGPTGVIGTLGEPCDSPGELACAGNHQKLTVVCGGDGEWEVNQTCAGDQFCDSQAGASAGTCQEAVAECVGLEPGTRYCASNTLMECGVDTVTANALEECAGVCEQNACNNTKDACPEGDAVNCAADCGGPSEACSNSCPPAAPFSGLISPLTVRLPDYDELCDATCDPSVRGIFVQVSAQEGQRVKVTVPRPWRMSVSLESFSIDAPCDPAAAEDCVILEGTNQIDYLYISTDDASAEPRNAVLEYVDEEATCL